jgi:iduronate 2-sulfatase
MFTLQESKFLKQFREEVLLKLLDNPEKQFRDVAYSRFKSGDAVISDNFTYTSYNNGKSEMLYDLSKDPEENHNVAGKDEYSEIKGKMKKYLSQQIKEAQKVKF